MSKSRKGVEMGRIGKALQKKKEKCMMTITETILEKVSRGFRLPVTLSNAALDCSNERSLKCILM